MRIFGDAYIHLTPASRPLNTNQNKRTNGRHINHGMKISARFPDSIRQILTYWFWISGWCDYLLHYIKFIQRVQTQTDCAAITAPIKGVFKCLSLKSRNIISWNLLWNLEIFPEIRKSSAKSHDFEISYRPIHIFSSDQLLGHASVV